MAAIVGLSALVLWRADILFRGAGENVEITGESGQRVVLEIRAADASVEMPNSLGLDIGLEEGKLAPNFEVSTFDGERVQLAGFRGRPVFLSFWASWCAPCRAEMPAIQAVLNQYEDQGLVVLGVDDGERFEPAQGFVEELKLDFAELELDPGQDGIKRYRVLLMPTSVFIDAEGVITKIHAGQAAEQQMEGFVRKRWGWRWRGGEGRFFMRRRVSETSYARSRSHLREPASLRRLAGSLPFPDRPCGVPVFHPPLST